MYEILKVFHGNISMRNIQSDALYYSLFVFYWRVLGILSELRKFAESQIAWVTNSEFIDIDYKRVWGSSLLQGETSKFSDWFLVEFSPYVTRRRSLVKAKRYILKSIRELDVLVPFRKSRTKVNPEIWNQRSFLKITRTSNFSLDPSCHLHNGSNQADPLRANFGISDRWSVRVRDNQVVYLPRSARSVFVAFCVRFGSRRSWGYYRQTICKRSTLLSTNIDILCPWFMVGTVHGEVLASIDLSWVRRTVDHLYVCLKIWYSPSSIQDDPPTLFSFDIPMLGVS